MMSWRLRLFFGWALIFSVPHWKHNYRCFPLWPFKDVRLAIHHGGHNNNITRMVKARKLICFASRQTVLKRIWLPVPSGNCDTEIGLAVFQQWRTQLACPLFLTAWRRQISQAVGRTETSSLHGQLRRPNYIKPLCRTLSWCRCHTQHRSLNRFPRHGESWESNCRKTMVKAISS